MSHFSDFKPAFVTRLAENCAALDCCIARVKREITPAQTDHARLFLQEKHGLYRAGDTSYDCENAFVIHLEHREKIWTMVPQAYEDFDQYCKTAISALKEEVERMESVKTIEKCIFHISTSDNTVFVRLDLTCLFSDHLTTIRNSAPVFVLDAILSKIKHRLANVRCQDIAIYHPLDKVAFPDPEFEEAPIFTAHDGSKFMFSDNAFIPMTVVIQKKKAMEEAFQAQDRANFVPHFEQRLNLSFLSEREFYGGRMPLVEQLMPDIRRAFMCMEGAMSMHMIEDVQSYLCWSVRSDVLPTDPWYV